MPAAKEELSRVTDISGIKCLGVIAGGGNLPEKLVQSCESAGIDTFVVGFEGQTDPDIVRGRNHIWTRLGAAGHIIKTLKAHGVRDVVLIGSIRRPSFLELKPDLKAAEFFAKVGLRALGDNDILGIVRETLEEEGFRLHGVHKFATDLLAASGVMGSYKPKLGDWGDIVRGLEISQKIGALDVGQSVIVQEGIVLGVEAIEGTDELIKRCKPLHRKGRKPVLVKTCKPQQDMDIDLPTIGPETVEQAAANGLGGIVVHEGATLVLDPIRVAEIADKHKIYVLGINPAHKISLSENEI